MRTEAQKIINKKWAQENSDKMQAACKRYRKTHPNKAKLDSAAWRLTNPDRAKNDSVKWRKQNPTWARAHTLKVKYGLTVGKFEGLLTSQNGSCKGCNKLFLKTPCVDHDHTTGFVRGLLCKKCNTTLGLTEDSETTLLSLVDYLRRSRYEQSKSSN